MDSLRDPGRHGLVVDHGVLVARDPADDPRILRWARRRALLLSAGLLAIAVVFTVFIAVNPVDPAFQAIDDAVNDWMVGHRASVVTSLAKVLAFLGSAVVMWPFRVAITAVLLVRRRFTQTAAFVLATILAELCIGPLKAALGRPRPPDPLVEVTSAAFPSGHAIAMAVTAFGLVVAFLPRSRRRLWWIGVAGFLAASMALSRVYVSAHWLTDTIAGALIGVGFALGCEAVFEQTRTIVAEHHDHATEAKGAEAKAAEVKAAESAGQRLGRVSDEDAQRRAADDVEGQVRPDVDPGESHASGREERDPAS